MTTTVKVMNISEPGDNNEHTILVIGGEGSSQTVAPGGSAIVNVWQGTIITVTEVETSTTE